MSATATWTPIGTVVGSASTHEYTFILRSFRASVGDIVAIQQDVPADGAGTRAVHIWGRITSIERYNPFFPVEAAQELSEEGIDIQSTVLSTARDQLQATVLVLGFTPAADDSRLQMFPLTYPVQPATRVLYPPAPVLQQLLTGHDPSATRIKIGNLISRTDVPVSLEANPVLARHMAILAMTGGGKTVAARRILRELISVGYPLLIIDPHGDYLGLWEKRSLLGGVEVGLFYPHIEITDRNVAIIHSLISKMTTGISEPQRDVLNTVLERVAERLAKKKPPIVKFIDDLIGEIWKASKGGDATKGALTRQLRFVRGALDQMERTNNRLRKQLSTFTFERLPDPHDGPEELIMPRKVSIIYLAGYDHLTQSTVVSIVLEGLFQHRLEMSDRIPPFLVVVEEAHNFVPSQGEGQTETPSLTSIRKLITEGRKFGTGLLLISQRPSRLDATVLSQCNSFLILRLVNPQDQRFVRSVMENLTDDDARALPAFGPGQGVISGQAVRFPLFMRVRMDEDLMTTGIGNEDFLRQAAKWAASPAAKRLRRSHDVASRLSTHRKRGRRA